MIDANQIMIEGVLIGLIAPLCVACVIANFKKDKEKKAERRNKRLIYSIRKFNEGS